MQTTINIHKNILFVLAKAAGASGSSVSGLIVFLLKKTMADASTLPFAGKPVVYQKKVGDFDWQVFHIVLREDEYEFFLDLRKVLKMSVSLILAQAVRKYLQSPNKIDSTDNYPHQNYIMIKEHIGTIICWRFIWGFPPDIGSLL